MPPRSRSCPAAAVPPSRGRGRPVDRGGDETRADILLAAQRRFGRAGYNGVSMEAIAAECGVNARALYYHFSSKRVLFDAAAAAALDRFGHEVLAAVVFSRTGLRDRLDGYVDVFRQLRTSDPHVLAFVGMFLVDGVARSAAGTSLQPHATAFRTFLEVVVDDAIAAGEVHPDLDRDGALLLLTSMGMGLAVASLDAAAPYPEMLDALDLWNRGELFREPRPAPRRCATRPRRD